MSARRPLGDMLVEITTGTLDALASAPGLRVRRIALTVPVEIQLSRAGNQTNVLGDLPRLVTRTVFDIKPSRLEVVWEEGDLS